MYKKHFSLNRPPFSTVPEASSYYPAESIEAANRTALQVLENGSGISLVIGESGVGKSLLLRVLEKTLENDCHVVYMANPRLKSPKSLYQHLLFSLHQTYCGMDENELRLLFLDHLLQAETRGMILLIDEAQSLGRSTLEELRVLLHYNQKDNRECVRLVLAGDHRFEERLTHPYLNAFQQQVVARCYLEKFRLRETDDEILWQLKQAGCETPELVFLSEARKTVHQLTDGIPRVVHQLCQLALVQAAELDLTHIDETVVQTAWSILQNLPVNGSRYAETSQVDGNGTSIVEFGALDDDEPMTTFDSKWNTDDAPYEEFLLPDTKVMATETTWREAVVEPPYCFPPQEFEPVGCGDALSDKVAPRQKQPQVPQRESCQKLIDEFSIMENWFNEEISVLKSLKKIEGDSLSRRVRRVLPTDIVAGFPDVPKKT